MIRRGVWAAMVAALICAGCGSGAAGVPSAPGSQAGEHLGVPMLPASAGTAHIVGGTAAMRTRARAILGRMGRTSVVEVRFGAAPAEFGQFRGLPAPDWITTTVAVTRDPMHGGVWAELAGLPALWEAGVFEHAHLAGTRPGEPRIRGTSEAFATPAGRRDFTAEPAFPPRYPGPALSRRGVRTAVAAAATRAGFHVVAVRFIAADRLAATVVVSAPGRKGFARRYVRFRFELGQMRALLAGLQWQIVDRCGTPVAVDSAGSWTNPRWLCPAPAILGPATSPARCRRLARSIPRC